MKLESDTYKTVYASDIFYLLGLWLSKISVLCLQLRLSPEYVHTVVVKGVLASSGAVLSASIVMVGLGCDSLHPWQPDTRECKGLVGRYYDLRWFFLC